MFNQMDDLYISKDIGKYNTSKLFVIVYNFRGADASVSSKSEIISAQNLTVSYYRDSLDCPASIPEIFERRT